MINIKKKLISTIGNLKKFVAGKKILPSYQYPLENTKKFSITVFTSITGGKDRLIDDQNTLRANFVAFTDQESKVWKTLKPYDKFKDERINSRIHKIMPHLFFDTEYSIWMDGNVKLKVPAQEIVDKFLKEKDIALWKHQNRDCIYEEAEACYNQNKDSAKALGEQIAAYKKLGVPAHGGLFAATVIIRRHTKRINDLNEKWWAHYCRYSKRDQISFPVVFPASEVHCIEDGTMWKNQYFERAEHTKDL